MDEVVASNSEWVRPDTPCGVGVLVVAGSSGVLPVDRAKLFADRGAEALALRWFGGPGQPSTPAQVPLELFESALDSLASVTDRTSIVGASFGAEAALCLAVRMPSIVATVAIAPTPYVWPGRTESGRMTSHWTWRDEPLPFVPLAADWEPDDEPPSFRRWYEVSALDAPADARVRCEDIAGDLVLVAGGDDRVWPSSQWAREIERHRSEHGLSTTVVEHPEAGHRPIFPGEPPPPSSAGRPMRRGGNPDADAELGSAAWPIIVSTLGLSPAR